MKQRLRAIVMAIAFCVTGIAAAAAADSAEQTLAVQATTMDQLATPREPSQVTTKFASDFAGFAGSQENAEALIAGLRNGTPITLSGTTITGGTTTASTTIIPPTQPMGYGNTYISLSLAKAQLAAYGITNPTPEELNAVLTGGSFTTTSVAPDGTVITKVVTVEGILTQRAAGMGWGQIAQANGFKLGQVISGMKSANKSLTTTQTVTRSIAHTTTGSRSGTPAAAAAKGQSTSYVSKGGAHAGSYAPAGRGITTALGGGVVYGKSQARSSTQVASLNGHGAGGASHARGAGIATASGDAALHGNAGGRSGSAPGQTKGTK